MSGAPMAEGGAPPRSRTVIGRYALYPAFSMGGMASVHFARLLGDVGFSRVVAIKRLHEQFAKDADFAAMLLDEARLAATIHHPNVVATLDVLATDDELFLVMEYVRGESLDSLLKAAAAQNAHMPPEHAVAVVVGALHGLHAAHEAKSPMGQALGIVHRDVSPHNILVGEDGVARIIDFGIAKAVERIHSTRDGELRGKIGYMAPEQISKDPVDRRADVYAASVVLWEALTHKTYIEGDNIGARLKTVLERTAEAPSAITPGVPRELDAIVLRGLSRQPSKRFETALEMATALEGALRRSSQGEVGAWVTRTAAESLRTRAEALAAIESDEDSNRDAFLADTGSNRSVSQPPLPLRASAPPAPPRSSPSLSPPSSPTERVAHVITATPEASPARPFWRRAALPAALLGLLAAAVVLRFALREASQPTIPENTSSTSMPSAIITPTASASDVPAPALTAVATASASTQAPQAKPVPATSARIGPRVRPGCNPPYTMDHGIKVPKLECL